MIKLISNDEKKLVELVKGNTYIIQYIENPTEDMQLASVHKFGYNIQYIKNPTEKVQLAAVKQNGSSIKYIKNPSKEVQLAAVREDGYAIQYISDPSEEVQLEAVKQNGCAIQYIENPSEEIQLEAVKQNVYAIEYISNPSEEVQLEVVKQRYPYAVENIKTKLCEKATDYLINNPIEMYKMTNNIYVFKTTGRDVVCEYKDNQWHYSLGCQYNITKDVFIDRIYNDGEGDPDKRPHRKQYLEVIDYVENLDMNK